MRARRLAAGHQARLQARGHLRRPSSCRTRRTSTRPTRRECEAEPTDRKKVMILGSGPNRIGQGIEFDYCCCHASFAFKEEGYETIMVNCNPETVSTDYDTSDRLYFEPLTFEDVMNIVELEKPEGVVIQFGGQTPLRAGPAALPGRACKILGTSPDAIDLAEDRKRFSALLARAGHPAAGERHRDLARRGQGGGRAHRLPGAGAAVVRAGRAGHGHRLRRRRASRATCARRCWPRPEHPILVDRFLEDAYEVDVDAVARRRARGDRRHPAAHRGGGRPQRRLRHGAARPTRSRAEHLETIRDYTRRAGPGPAACAA